MTARLHVMLGEGGVGKTTLAAAYALALAAGGRRVALLGIDPARRLQGALGISLEGGAARVPAAGELHAALLFPEATLRRWATEGLRDPDRLLANRFFGVLADRLATTTDVIAAVRIAEWAEEEPTLTDFVVDTAPGRNGLEFLTRPTALASLVRGRLGAWLRRPHGAARRIVRGLSHIGGAPLLSELLELASFAEQPVGRILDRLERAQAWLHDPATELLLVTAVREDARETTRALRDALAESAMRPSAVVVNRTIPRALAAEIAEVDARALEDPARAIVRYVRAFGDIQTRVVDDARALAPRVIEIPAATGLDGPDRLAALAAIGGRLFTDTSGSTGAGDRLR